MGEQAVERYRRAFARFREGNLSALRDELRELSEAGYAPAQAFLGWCFASGTGGAIDRAEARRWYAAAARAGDAVGQYYLGVFSFQEGQDAVGADLLRASARQDYAPALYRLGLAYERGKGTVADEAQACDCWEKAAALGHPFAQRKLALRMIRGRAGFSGVVQGIWWFCKLPWIGWRLSKEDREYLMYP